MFRKSRARQPKQQQQQQQHQQQQHHQSSTEAAAHKSLESNQVAFGYPEEGFVHKVEFSLIYAMLREPNIYPRSVLLQHIRDEDFSLYLAVNHDSRKSRAGGVEEERVSYRQLSALLALSAEHYPPAMQGSGHDSNDNNVSDALAKAILRLVMKYADEHNLNRETELRDLFQPVEIYADKRNTKAEMKGVLSLYAGYAAALALANPVPFVVGLAVYSAKVNQHAHEMENIKNIQKETRRRADIEKTSLLDEAQDDF